jgi:hypothetical protein
MGGGFRLLAASLAGSASASDELEAVEVDEVTLEPFEIVEDVFADLVEVLQAMEPSERPPIEVPLRTDPKEREELVEHVDPDRLDGGTGAEGLGGKETEGELARDLEIDHSVSVTAWRARRLGGPSI